jgi:hypothetical protein
MALPLRADRMRAVTGALMAPAEAAQRFGLESGAEGDVAVVLLDVWPRYSLEWYTPPPGGPAERPAPAQTLVAVFRAPFTDTLQVRRADLSSRGGRFSDLAALEAGPQLEWE